MSDLINTELLERASEVMDYFEGKVLAEVIEKDLDTNDLSALVAHVAIGEAQMAQQEFHEADIA